MPYCEDCTCTLPRAIAEDPILNTLWDLRTEFYDPNTVFNSLGYMAVVTMAATLALVVQITCLFLLFYVIRFGSSQGYHLFLRAAQRVIAIVQKTTGDARKIT
jgi:hypothetical protein